MSNVSDIEARVTSVKSLSSRFDCIEVERIDSLDVLIALSQVYQYRNEYAAITADSDCIAEAALCGRRICEISDYVCRIYPTLRDIASCIRALEYLRTVEYSYDLHHLKPFVNSNVDVLRHSAHLTDANRLVLAIISGEDDERLVCLAEKCAARTTDAAAARASLTASAIMPGRIPLDSVAEWFDCNARRLSHQSSISTSADLQLIALAPLVWNSLPSMRSAVESLATLNPRADLTADMALASLRAFLALTSLIASITAA